MCPRCVLVSFSCPAKGFRGRPDQRVRRTFGAEDRSGTRSGSTPCQIAKPCRWRCSSTYPAIAISPTRLHSCDLGSGPMSVGSPMELPPPSRVVHVAIVDKSSEDREGDVGRLPDDLVVGEVQLPKPDT